MTWLAAIAVSNAVVASLLGILAYVVGRWPRNAAVGHALWILVLVKLVTPPLFDVPLPILPDWAVAATPLLEKSQLVTDQKVVQGDRRLRGDVATAITMEAAAADRFPTDLSANLNRVKSLVPWFMGCWSCGIFCYGSYRLYVTWQMCKLMRLGTPDPRIDRAMHRVAKAANVRNYPTARVVPWVGSPMLWGLGGTSVIVLPADLFKSMDDETADTLLQHELAHFQRGDQWVRILEVLVSTLFWWHPIVWLALREIEVHEEQCCDSWVVGQNSENRRRYAEALLDTVDFISGVPQKHPTPIAASGLGRVTLLKQRLRAIMRGEQQVLTSRGRIAIVIMLCVVPLQPKLLRGSLSVAKPTHNKLDKVAVIARVDAGLGDEKPTTRSLPRDVVRTVPGLEYANATSTYGIYELVATSGYRVRLRDVLTNNTIDLSSRQISCAAFAPASAKSPPHFAAGSKTGKVWLFACETGASTQVASYGCLVHSVAYSPDGARLAAGTDDGTVRLIDLINGTEQHIDSFAGPIRCVRFSDGSDRLVVVIDTTWQLDVPGSVEVWNLTTMAREQQIFCPSAVGVAAFHSTGNIFTAEWNGAIRIWSSSGEQLATWSQPKDLVSAVSFSPNAGQDMLEAAFTAISKWN